MECRDWLQGKIWFFWNTWDSNRKCFLFLLLFYVIVIKLYFVWQVCVLNADHTGPVQCVQFNPKYMMLASGCTNMVGVNVLYVCQYFVFCYSVTVKFKANKGYIRLFNPLCVFFSNCHLVCQTGYICMEWVRTLGFFSCACHSDTWPLAEI